MDNQYLPKRNNPILILLWLGFLLTTMAPSAQAESTASGGDSDNWSLDFKGGITTGQFTFDSRMTGHGGFQLRYSMNPLVSMYGAFGVGVFRAPDEMMSQTGFSNDYFTGGLGLRVNVLRMLAGHSPVTDRLAVYTTTGLQFMRADVRVRNREVPGYAGNNFSGNAMILNLGAGAAIRINRRVDLFLQTELHHSDSDLLDGYERLPGAPRTGFISGGDSYINTSAGISIKLGGTEVRHADWRYQERGYRTETRPASVERELAELRSELQRSDRIKEELARRLQSMAANLTEFSELVNTTQQQQLDSQELRLEQLQNRVTQLQEELATLSPATAAETAGRTAPRDQAQVAGDPRYFVVAGAFRNRDNAERLLQQITAQGYGQASIVTDPQRGFHVVTYSGHVVREQAERELVQVRSRVNPDAWIFTRPD